MKTYLLAPLCLLFFTTGSLQAQDFLHASANGTITVYNGGILFVNGGIGLDDNSIFSNNGIVTLARTGAGSADFTDNTSSPYNYGSGKFVFTGTGTQNISSINQFERIDVDNTGLNLLSSIKANTWYLKTGKVNTGSFTAIASSAAETSVQADGANSNYTNSWINGKLQRSITPASVNTYQFPVGDATNVYMATMDNLTAGLLTGVSNVTASFGPKPGNDAGLNVSEMGIPYTSVNTGGVWYLVPDINPTGGTYDVRLYFNGYSGLEDNKFGILRRPDASSTASEWMVPAGSTLPGIGTAGRTIASGYALRKNISTFSQFGIGSSLAPLPLRLLSFSAVKKDKNVLLQWTTANETNTSHFELLRGGQPVSMQYLDKLNAAGSSTSNRTYTYTDYKPLSGMSFYQLKMVDIDNNYKLSQVVKVNFDDITSLKVYPNPVSGKTIFVDLTGAEPKEVKLIATDGKQVACNFIIQGNNQLKVTLPTGIAKGSYVLQLHNDDGNHNTTVLVQ